MVLSSGDGGVAGIGNGQAGTGTTDGNITINSGGNLTLASTGAGNARIGTGNAADSTIDVTATGNISLSTAPDGDGTTIGGNSFIGNFVGTSGPVSGNVTVTSTGGAIGLYANERRSIRSRDRQRHGRTCKRQCDSPRPARSNLRPAERIRSPRSATTPTLEFVRRDFRVGRWRHRRDRARAIVIRNDRQYRQRHDIVAERRHRSDFDEPGR